MKTKEMRRYPPAFCDRDLNRLEGERRALNAIDEKILLLLQARARKVLQIARKKRALQIPVVQTKRRTEVLRSRSERGRELGLDPIWIKKVWRLLMAESERIQKTALKQDEAQ